MSGELETTHATQPGAMLQYGPNGTEDPNSPFTSRQLARLDEALTLLADGFAEPRVRERAAARPFTRRTPRRRR